MTGRALFTVPNLFETSTCLQGGNEDDGWFFVHVEFLFNVGGHNVACCVGACAARSMNKAHN